MDDFEKKLQLLNLGLLLAEAEADFRLNRTREAREFLKEFKGSAKISGLRSAPAQPKNI